MGKDKKNKPAVQAPVQEAPATEEKTNVVNAGFIPKSVSGLSPDAKVTYFATLHDRYGKAENLSEDLKNNPQLVHGMNTIADMVGVAIAVEECVTKGTILQEIVSKNEKGYNALRLVADGFGVELPAPNLLPAPTKEQSAQAGLPAGTSDAGVLNIDPNKVDDATKKQILAEKKVVDSKPAESPADVKDEKQLQASLLNIFVKGDRPVARAKKAINFYRAYLKLQNKDKQEELDKIEAMSDAKLLSDVKDIVGACPYKDRGISQHLRKLVAATGSPITAYNLLLRSARNRKTGEVEATNELIAAICRVYVIWSAEATIDVANEIIHSEERQLKKLDEKKHAEAIETINKNIEAKKADIEWANGVIEAVVSPNSDLVDNLIDMYNDENNESHNIAVVVVDDILKTYYPNQDMTQFEAECVENNAKQYAGIITNMFRDPASQLADYSEANIVELVKVAAAEEKTDDGADKKAPEASEEESKK